MSEIRDKSRRLLDDALPKDRVITSDGPGFGQYNYPLMTGLTQTRLAENWAGGGIMTGCNGFTGWYARQLGSKIYLGGFDLKSLARKAGKPESWIVSRPDNRPQYGDILRHTSFHVDVALEFEFNSKGEEILIRAAGGQGGKGVGHDIITRVRGKAAYNPKNIMGWIDIDLYFS